MSRGQFTPRHTKEAPAALPQEGKQAVVNERADGSSLSLSLSRDLPLRTRTRTSCRRGAVLSSTTRAMTRWRGNVRRRSGLGRPWSSSSSSSSPSPPPSLSPPPQHHRRSLSRLPPGRRTRTARPRHSTRSVIACNGCSRMCGRKCARCSHTDGEAASSTEREGLGRTGQAGTEREREAPDVGWVRASSHVALQWQSICTTVCTVLYCAGPYRQPRVVSIAWEKDTVCGWGCSRLGWVGCWVPRQRETEREGEKGRRARALKEGDTRLTHTRAWCGWTGPTP